MSHIIASVSEQPDGAAHGDPAADTGRTHHLTLPLTREAVDAVHAGDMVYISGRITCTIGLPTHERMVTMLDEGAPLPVDLHNGGFMHLSVFNRELADGSYEALYMNPTTSTRYVAYMPKLVEGYGLRIIGGKGGLNQASIDALQRQGCIYVSYLGGGCALLSKAIKRVVSVHWTDYISQFRLVTLEVEALGPATVAIDAHGISLYEQLRADATDKMPAILAKLNADRAAS